MAGHCALNAKILGSSPSSPAKEDMNTQMTSFIDESGVGDLTDHKYKNFVLTSVTVNNSELNTIYGYFSLIKKKYGLSDAAPFHSYDLLENPSSRFSSARAKSFIKSMCEFIELVPMNIVAIHTNKIVFRKQFKIKETDLKGSKENKEKRGLIYYLSALNQLQLFTKYLKSEDGVGYIHADSRTYQDRDLLDAFLRIKQKNIRGGLPSAYYDLAKRSLVSITFADKGALSNGIQLADFTSFVVFAYLERKISFYKDVGLSQAWGKLRGRIKLYKLNDSFGVSNIRNYL